MQTNKTNGLKNRRSNTKDSKPTHACPNCGCNRYSPCKCEHKTEKEVQA